VAAAAALVGVLVDQRSLIASSLAVVGHLRWMWLMLAVALEAASMAAFARMQRRLLSAGQARVRLFPVMATVYAGNAISASVPLGGTQMSAVFAFRRFKQLGVEATAAGWTLVVAGVISWLASALLLVVGAVLTGNDVVAVVGAVGGMVAVAVLVVAAAAARRPAVLTALHPRVVWVLRLTRRLLGRPVRDPDDMIAALAARMGSMRLPLSGWVAVVVLALWNWLADVGVLAASIVAVGAAVPWRGLLFAYGVGMAAGGIGVIPGGLGVIEAALAVSLMGAGVHHPLALAAVLVYRWISFWLLVAVGWLIYLVGMRTAGGGPNTSCRWLPLAGNSPGLSDRPGQVHLHLPVVVADLQARQRPRRRRQLREEKTA
jgi:hypothetical protein